MADPAKPAEPRRSWLRQIIESGPAGRRRMVDAVAWLMGTALVAMAALGGLLIWHLIRRGRLLRDRLDPPRIVRLPEIEGPHDADPDTDPENHGDIPPA